MLPRFSMPSLFRLASLVLFLASALPLAAAPRLLVFSKTTGFRHSSIPEGIAALARLGQAEGWEMTFTENAAVFTPEKLAAFDAVCFLSTTGDPLDAAQMDALKGFLAAGHGFAGIHAAADTETDDPWYPTMLGARFLSHPKPQTATLHVHHDCAEAALVSHLEPTWKRFDEWYDFREPVPADACVLLSLDESTYTGGKMGKHHPVAWTRRVGGGRVFYTALGHTEESYHEPLFLEHVRRGLRWALEGRTP